MSTRSDIKGMMVAAVMLLIILSAAVKPASAQSFTGANATVGRTASVRHAGPDNFTGEFYYTLDGSEPTAAMTPAYFLDDGMQPCGITRMPGDTTGRWWFLVKPLALNPGEVKSEKTDVAREAELPYRPELGGYLIDMTKLGGGKYHIRYSIEHLGEQIVRQFLFIDFRSQRAVTDQASLVLTVYDPSREYLPQEVEASVYLRGAEPGNGARTFREATGQNAPINLVATPGQTMPNLGTVIVRAFADQHQLVPGEGEFRLVSTDGSYATPYVQTSNGVATFKVPSGTYTLKAPPGQWQYPPGTPKKIVVPEAETTIHMIIERRPR